MMQEMNGIKAEMVWCQVSLQQQHYSKGFVKNNNCIQVCHKTILAWIWNVSQNDPRFGVQVSL